MQCNHCFKSTKLTINCTLKNQSESRNTVQSMIRYLKNTKQIKPFKSVPVLPYGNNDFQRSSGKNFGNKFN